MRREPNLVKSPPYKMLLLACSLVWVFSLSINALLPQKEVSIDWTVLPENYMPIEGYVASKRMNSIWVVSEPLIIGERSPGFTPSPYLIVSPHQDVKGRNIFKKLKVNQKVRVYGDYLRESNPGKTTAYLIEIIEKD